MVRIAFGQMEKKRIEFWADIETCTSIMTRLAGFENAFWCRNQISDDLNHFEILSLRMEAFHLDKLMSYPREKYSIFCETFSSPGEV